MSDQLFKNDAKSIVDTLFDTKVFADKVTRDNMQELEALIEYMMQSRYNSRIKAMEIMDRIKNG